VAAWNTGDEPGRYDSRGQAKTKATLVTSSCYLDRQTANVSLRPRVRACSRASPRDSARHDSLFKSAQVAASPTLPAPNPLDSVLRACGRRTRSSGQMRGGEQVLHNVGVELRLRIPRGARWPVSCAGPLNEVERCEAMHQAVTRIGTADDLLI